MIYKNPGNKLDDSSIDYIDAIMYALRLPKPIWYKRLYYKIKHKLKQWIKLF